jgi:predicted nucleic-acid-binding Zn-ribbon protein
MKSGICPKCKSEEVYENTNHSHGINVERFSFMIMNTILFVCAVCGYMEFYIENGQDLEKIKKEFRKVEN